MFGTNKKGSSGENIAEQVLLLDASAFILGYDTTGTDVDLYTVPLVREELREGGLARLRLDSAVRNGRLKMVKPDPSHTIDVGMAVAEMGEANVLSETDSQLLALGVQLISKGLSPIIVSDDYAIQNVANSLGLKFRSLATTGIKRQFEWVTYCPGCHKTFQTGQPEGLCPVCGTKLRRKPVKKKWIR
ncbi:MAG: hypothetical protein NWE75_02070 [Candidatus Bathyarchaeota archaeon]|nr:hypothetical protein [Candidatus Bathyarchaeota archaeon]